MPCHVLGHPFPVDQSNDVHDVDEHSGYELPGEKGRRKGHLRGLLHSSTVGLFQCRPRAGDHFARRYRLDGDIELRAEPGKGFAYELRLPLPARVSSGRGAVRELLCSEVG